MGRPDRNGFSLRTGRIHGTLPQRFAGSSLTIYAAPMTTVDEVKAILKDAYGLTVIREQPIQHGTQVVTKEGPQVNVFTSGKCVPNGKSLHLIEGFEQRVAGGPVGNVGSASRNVFVVYGHDTAARTELEAMLRRWNLVPILLDQLANEGDTLIEKLERTTDAASFAVVLATPDDEGHRKDRADEKKYRARQNVVLELGMMLQALGRRRVAVLLPQLDRGVMERPSDIDGLIYIPYTDSVSDAKVQLAKELNKQGLRIDLDSL